MSLQITGEATIEELPEHILVEIMRYLSMKDRCRAARFIWVFVPVSQTTVDKMCASLEGHVWLSVPAVHTCTQMMAPTSEVCTKWNKMLSYDSLWRHVDLLDIRIGLKTLWRLVRTRFSPRMSTLKLRGYDPIGNFESDNKGKDPLSDAVLKRIAAHCPNLQVLHLMDCNTKNFSMESLPTSIVCLEMVHCVLQPSWMTDKQKYLPKLEHLRLDTSVWIDSIMIDIFVWRNLKHLSISQCFWVGSEGVITIANNLYELEYLNIRLIDIDDYAVYHIALHLKKLRQLCLAQCPRVSDKGVVLIATGLPVLNKLDISHCRQVTMRGLETLFGGNIRELIVVGMILSNKEKQALKGGFAVTRFR